MVGRCIGSTSVVCLLGGILSAVAGAQGTQPEQAGIEFFESKVRPLLVARCYKCHSAQADPLKGGLMLDSRAGWANGGDSGPAIEPGDPDSSLLVLAVRYDDESLVMPPDGKLADEEIAILSEWVKLGAPDPRGDVPPPVTAEKPIDVEAARQYWAFQPLSRPAPPAVAMDDWCRTPIDRFILAPLEQKELAPNREADRRTLLRRAWFDVVGLPPPPEEVEAFVHDPAPDAWQRAVDKLLASPHYGERWGRHWLDLARFAESHGFEQDYDRPHAYHYRDFVIRALNEDLAYDTFVRWQIAGDEIEPDDPMAMMATGFLAAGVHATQITASQAEKERYDELDDMTRTIGTSMLGLTIGCARCHDHKFDPISNSDYYRLLSTFSTTVRSVHDVNLEPEEYRLAKAAFDLEHAPLVAAREQFEREQLPGRFESWLAARPASAAQEPPIAWVLAEPVESKSAGGATLTKQDDASLVVSGTNPDHDTYTFVIHTPQTGITALRIEALSDESLDNRGPGRSENGSFSLSEVKVTAAPRDGSAGPVAVELAAARSTFDQEGQAAGQAIDGKMETCWSVAPQAGRDHAAVFETAGDVCFEGGTVVNVTLEFRTHKQQAIGRPRLSLSTAARPVAIDGREASQRVVDILARIDGGGTLADEDRPPLESWYRRIDPEWLKLDRQVAEHARQAPQPDSVKALISSEGVPAVRLHTQGEDFYDPVYFLKRGDPNNKLDVAQQGFVEVLMRAPQKERRWQVEPPPGWRTSYRRRSLANWITDVEYGAGHLLARVIVNRLWQHHLGRGIVSTPSDFGSQGEPPTHPELLDWLATELIEGGWRLKRIHRLIMTSAVYMQSDEADPDRMAADNENRLWWRREPRRLEAEVIRDSMLAAGGTLEPRMFGPGTLDPGHRRRSIYFFIKRSELVPMMILFDAPDALQDIAQRSTTTVAPQALALLNNDQVRDAARHFAGRVDGQDVSLETAVTRGYQIALARPPTPAETADAVAFLQGQIASYEADGKPNGRELALSDFCQVLMGLNEFIYVD